MGVLRLVAIPCKLSSAIFPSERAFEVTLANGDIHRGITPRFFCWNATGQIVGENENGDGKEGMVAAKEIAYEDLPAGIVAVEVPDGEVLAVEKEAVLPRPTKIFPPGIRVA